MVFLAVMINKNELIAQEIVKINREKRGVGKASIYFLIWT